MKLKFFGFAIKRMLKTPSYLICLFCLFGAIVLSSFVGERTNIPIAGVVNHDLSKEAKQLENELLEKDFVECKSEEELTNKVEKGELNCGIIIKNGLIDNLCSGELKEALVFVSSPLTYTAELYLGYAQSFLFAQYVPYITSDLLKETGMTLEQVKNEYEEQFREGYIFEFDILTVDGKAISTKPSKANDILMAAISILVFMALFTSSVSIVHKDVLPMINRIGFAATKRYILFPSVISQLLLCILFTVLPLTLLSGLSKGNFSANLVLPSILYAAIISQLGMLLALLFHDSRNMYLLLPFLLIGTLALCPIFTDLSIFIPVIRVVRVFLPTYWFWLTKEIPYVFIIVEAVLFILQYKYIFAKKEVKLSNIIRIP